MNNEVSDIIKKYDEACKKYQKFCFLSRDMEYQKDAIESLLNLEEETIKIKEIVIAKKDVDSANAMLCLRNMIEGLINEFKMWIAFKENKTNDAWDFLINAQDCTRAAFQAHNIASNLEFNIKRLELLEKLLFPKPIFMSTGMIIENAVCSICGKEYDDCEHIIGKLYMGKFCYRIINKVKELKEVSIVENPADKRARVTTVSDGKVNRDFMTWKIIEDD